MWIKYGSNSKYFAFTGWLLITYTYETQIVLDTVVRLIQKFKRTGPVENEARSERSKTATDEGRPTSTMVLIAMVESPKKRTLRLSAELHILHTNKWNPYKMQMLQHPDGKVQFCE